MKEKSVKLDAIAYRINVNVGLRFAPAARHASEPDAVAKRNPIP